MPAVSSSCAVGLLFGKNTGAKYREKAAYEYQSYHSTRLPTDPLTMARTRPEVPASLSTVINSAFDKKG